MENGFLQNWPKVPEGQNLQLRKKILLFSVFLLVSVFIWLLNALSKSYTTDLEFPIEYTDFPEDMVFVGDIPDRLDLSVNGHGFVILKYNLFRKPVPISFQVSSITVNRLDNSSAYILTRNLRNQVSVQLPSELRLLEINPDTLHFQFAQKVSKIVQVKPDIHFDLDNQFTTVGGISVVPDSVEVTGPDLVLDTLSYVPTERIDLGLLHRNYREKLKLAGIRDLEYTNSRVECSIELERYTEVQLTVPVEVENLPDSLIMQTFPSGIKLTCRVGLSKYDRINNNPFRAVVDYSEIGSTSRQVEVRLMNIPSYLLSYEYTPRNVEFLISRKP